jgi:antitoxin VapB
MRIPISPAVNLDISRALFYILLEIIDAGEGSMALSLKDKETDRLARAVAAITGETLTDAIRIALAERLDRERLRRGEGPRLAGHLMGIGRHCAALPDLDPRSADEIVGYDENGLW